MSKKKKILSYEEEQYRDCYSRDFDTFEEYIQADGEIREIRLFNKERLFEELAKRLEVAPNNQLYLKELWDYYINNYELGKATEVADRLENIAPKSYRYLILNMNDSRNNYIQAIGAGNIHKIPTENLEDLYRYRIERHLDNDVKFNNKLLEEINKRKSEVK